SEGSVVGSVTSVEQEPGRSIESEVKMAMDAANDLFSSFVGGGYDVNQLYDALNDLSVRIADDDEFKDYLNDFFQCFESWLKEGIDESRFKEIVHNGRQTVYKKYQQQLDNIYDQINLIVESLKEDKLMSKLGSDISQLTRDLFVDENNNPTIKPELFYDAQKLLPVIVEQIKYIPVPRQDISDEDYDF
ncbi:hypothetical protein ROZALSC1DRAFT_26230, partial [Rozella allomycis CSF55]